jgi:hypothetical protein
MQLSLEELAERLESIGEVRSKNAFIGASTAEAGRILRSLEYGSAVGEPPWPGPGGRTTLAVDPETGAQVVVSLQAPAGFIRIRRGMFLEALRRTLDGPVNWLNAGEAAQHVEEALRAAGERTLSELKSGVPVDSGRTAQSLIMAFTMDTAQSDPHR